MSCALSNARDKYMNRLSHYKLNLNEDFGEMI